MTSTLDTLGAAQYLLVTTYRRDGRPVPTPMWAARDGDAIVVWSVTNAGKVRRIRRNPEVRVAPCDVRGRVNGDHVGGQAAILDGVGTERVRQLLREKYGLRGRITLWGSRVRRGRDGTIGIRITISD